ncbi:MAG: hypothetical protein HY559_05505 [Gammaproteobacteria bacterium]|nr:hypothetical protein [Gammaproteobacteria bacterium]
MLSFLKRKKHKEWLGISFEEDGVAVAHLYLKEDTIPCLKFCGFFPSTIEKEQRAWLANILGESAAAKQAACSLVLPPKSYHLLCVEPPSVEASEVSEALRWQLKDMLPFPAEEAVIDYFELCEHPPPGKPPSIYAVAAQKSVIQSFVDFANQQKLNLVVIDIRECILGALLANLGLEVLSRAVLMFKEASGLLAIFCEGGLYLARELPFGSSAFASPSDNTLWENLALEIQRSLDYYDSHFGQKPVTEVLVMPMINDAPHLEEELTTRLGVGVRHLDLHQVFETDLEFSREEEAKSLFAIAATFRMMLDHETEN